MSQILAQWVTNDVGLGEKIIATNLDTEFASGYLFGKLLDVLGFEDDFGSRYVRGSSTDALLKNYASLEHTLRERLGIRLTSSQTLDLIHKKAGSASRLLFEIRTRVDVLEKEQRNLPKLRKKSVFESYPSSPAGNANFDPRAS
jgi:hypothetical protein